MAGVQGQLSTMNDRFVGVNPGQHGSRSQKLLAQ
jgi:hypothetical protein